MLAVAAGVDGVLAATRAVRGEFDALRRDAAAAILAAVDGDARPALWGLGGDFFRLLAASPALTEAVGSGRFDLADSTLAGNQWRGQTIVGAAAVAGGGGAGSVTPRPQKIYAGMLAAANRLGIASQRLRRPYADA